MIKADVGTLKHYKRKTNSNNSFKFFKCLIDGKSVIISKLLQVSLIIFKAKQIHSGYTDDDSRSIKISSFFVEYYDVDACWTKKSNHVFGPDLIAIFLGRRESVTGERVPWTVSTWSTSSMKQTISSSSMRSRLPPLTGRAIGTGTVSVMCFARGDILSCLEWQAWISHNELWANDKLVLLSSCLTHYGLFANISFGFLILS